jgi:hypothetical protein
MVEHDQRTCICQPDPTHPPGSIRGTSAGAVIPNKDCPIESHSLAGYRAADPYRRKIEGVDS